MPIIGAIQTDSIFTTTDHNTNPSDAALINQVYIYQEESRDSTQNATSPGTTPPWSGIINAESVRRVGEASQDSTQHATSSGITPPWSEITSAESVHPVGEDQIQTESMESLGEENIEHHYQLRSISPIMPIAPSTQTGNRTVNHPLLNALNYFFQQVNSQENLIVPPLQTTDNDITESLYTSTEITMPDIDTTFIPQLR
jgi:hypothetical protein